MLDLQNTLVRKLFIKWMYDKSVFPQRNKMSQIRPKEDKIVQYEKCNFSRVSSICSAVAITITLILITLISPIHCKSSIDVEWREGFEGHGTVHEQMGQPHWPEPEYSAFKFKYSFLPEPKYYNYKMDWLFNITHFIFDNILDSQPPLPLSN